MLDAACFASRLLLGWGNLCRAQSDIGELKVAVGADNTSWLKCSVLSGIGRTRSYPNFMGGSYGLARLVFSGHVDHHSTNINPPACMCVYCIKMLQAGKSRHFGG